MIVRATQLWELQVGQTSAGCHADDDSGMLMVVSPTITRHRILLLVVASLATVSALLLGASFDAEAQPPSKTVRIGIMSAGQTRSTPFYQAFEHRLRELGWVDGQNAAIEFRGADGDPERIRALTNDLVRLGIDLLLTGGPEVALRAAKEATSTIPTVMVAIDFDPVARGYVTSLPRPGGNITGIFSQQLDLTAKRLELVKEALPHVTRIAVFWDVFSVDQLKLAEVAARTLRFQLQPLELRNPPYDYERALRNASQNRAEALLVLSTPVIFRERARIAELATKSRMPTVFAFREHVEAGGLIAYGVNFSDMYRRAAEYADKILRGAKPADLPIEQPTKFELVINRKGSAT